LRPGDWSSCTKRTGTSTVIIAPPSARRKSMWSGSSLTGWSCASRGRTFSVSPPKSSSSTVLKKRGLLLSSRLISLSGMAMRMGSPFPP
jgi:hypothetical protein